MENYDTNIDKVNPEGVDYIDIKKIITVFESVQYDSLQMAAAEIIDNSVDANAKNVVVFIISKFNKQKGKPTVNEIAFLDNGDAMSPGKLQRCVGFGSSLGNNPNRIGRFGVGMNQASLYACDVFQVYSWQEENEVYVTEFDRNKIIKNNIKKALPPEKTKLPAYVTEHTLFKKYKCEEKGTLVVWKDIKSKHYAKSSTIANRMQSTFSEIFRNFLWNQSLHIDIQYDDNNTNVHAVDPMFLLENTDKLGDVDGGSKLCDYGEPLFEPFLESKVLTNGEKHYSVPYEKDDKSIGYSDVILKASIVKKKFYYDAAYKDNFRQPGDTEIGKYVKEYQKGITVMRNNRQIDFGYFNFYDSNNQPQDRWFKIQIEFTQELDDVFDVSNNKQHVTLKKVPNNHIADYKADDPNFPIWLRLNQDITDLLSEMRSRNKNLAKIAKNGIPVLFEPESKGNEIEDIFKPSEKKTIEVVGTVSKPTENDETIIIDNDNDDEETIQVTPKNPLQSFLESEDIKIFYEELNKKELYDIHFDFESNKYIITLNSDIVDEGNKELVVLLSLFIKGLDNAPQSSAVYSLLNEILNKYKKYSEKL